MTPFSMSGRIQVSRVTARSCSLLKEKYDAPPMTFGFPKAKLNHVGAGAEASVTDPKMAIRPCSVCASWLISSRKGNPMFWLTRFSAILISIFSLFSTHLPLDSFPW